MTIHLLTYISACLLALLSDTFKKKSRPFSLVLIILSCLIVLLPLAFRGQYVGIDTPAYYKIFYAIDISSAPYSLRYEPGFTFLNRLVAYFNYEAPTLIIISAILSIIPVYVFIYKNSSNIALSLSILWGIGAYSFMYNGVRQAIATAISLFALSYLLNNRLKSFILTVVSASLFHYSSLILLFAILLTRFRYKALTSLIIWFVSFIFLIPQFSSLLLGLISNITPEVYSSYTDLEIQSTSLRLRLITNQFFCLFFMYMLWINSKIKFNDKTLDLLYLSLFGFILGNFFFHLGYINRLLLYYQAIACVSIPLLLYKSFNYRSYITASIIMFIIFTTIYIRALSLGVNAITPYQTFWQEKSIPFIMLF